MIRADEYRERAAECERQAARAIDLRVTKQLKDIAVQWRELAERAEQLDRDRR
jgi:hypothetical protein